MTQPTLEEMKRAVLEKEPASRWIERWGGIYVDKGAPPVKCLSGKAWWLVEDAAWQSAYRALFGEQEGEKDAIPASDGDSLRIHGDNPSVPVPLVGPQEVARPEPAGDESMSMKVWTPEEHDAAAGKVYEAVNRRLECLHSSKDSIIAAHNQNAIDIQCELTEARGIIEQYRTVTFGSNSFIVPADPIDMKALVNNTDAFLERTKESR